MLPVLAIMIGDPAGIGPEVAVKALASGRPDEISVPILIGDLGTVEKAASIAGIDLPVEVLDRLDDPAPAPGKLRVFNPSRVDLSGCRFGEASEAAGRAVLEWHRAAMEYGRAGRIQGVVMAPRNTTSMKLAGDMSMPGEPEPGSYMLRMSGNLRVVPLTEHLRLVEAVAAVTPEKVLEVVRILHDALCGWGLPRPRIAVAGINPHAMFEEDKQRIGPAVEQARKEGIDVSGPAVPDAVFRQCIQGRHDAVVTMFHDQGQIAVKTVGFEGACTVHIGLPFVRISVPHGSAFDIAGKGVAKPDSMLRAISIAAQLAAGKGALV